MSIIMLIMLFYMISMSSLNIMSMWFFMEIGSFLFIYLLISWNNKPKSFILYFIINFISTILIFMSILINSTNTSSYQIMTGMGSTLMTTSLLLKIGAIPFHYWMLIMTENMEWFSLMVFFSIQKIVPIWMINYFGEYKMLIFSISLSIILFIWLPFKSKNVFSFLSTSSILNNSWIIISSLTSLMNSILYTLTYFIVNSNFIMMLKMKNMKSIANSMPMETLIFILSLMGFPPMQMFFMKLFTLKSLSFLSNQFKFISIALLISNMIMSILYIKFALVPLMEMKNNMHWEKTIKNMMPLNIILNISPMFFFISISFN